MTFLDRIKSYVEYAQYEELSVCEVCLLTMLIYLDEIKGRPENGFVITPMELMLMTHMSKASLYRSRDSLIERGLISVSGNGARRTLYKLLALPALEAVDDAEDERDPEDSYADEGSGTGLRLDRDCAGTMLGLCWDSRGTSLGLGLDSAGTTLEQIPENAENQANSDSDVGESESTEDIKPIESIEIIKPIIATEPNIANKLNKATEANRALDNIYNNIYNINCVREGIGGVGGREENSAASPQPDATMALPADAAQASPPAPKSKGRKKSQASRPKKRAPLEDGDVSEKIEAAEYVWLKPAELEKLKTRYGEEDALKIIEHMSLCKASKGYSYLSDYSAILKWGARAYYEEQTKIAYSQPIRQQERRYDNPHDFFEGGGI